MYVIAGNIDKVDHLFVVSQNPPNGKLSRCLALVFLVVGLDGRAGVMPETRGAEHGRFDLPTLAEGKKSPLIMHKMCTTILVPDARQPCVGEDVMRAREKAKPTGVHVCTCPVVSPSPCEHERNERFLSFLSVRMIWYRFSPFN